MTLFTVFGVVTLNGYHLTFSPFSLIVDYFVIKAGLDSFNEHAYTKKSLKVFAMGIMRSLVSLGVCIALSHHLFVATTTLPLMDAVNAKTH